MDTPQTTPDDKVQAAAADAGATEAPATEAPAAETPATDALAQEAPEATESAEPTATEDEDDLESLGDFGQVLEQWESGMKTLKEGELVKGRVIKILEKEVIVDIGYKSEGVIEIDGVPRSLRRFDHQRGRQRRGAAREDRGMPTATSCCPVTRPRS